MKRLEHFPESIFSFKMIDVPAEWQDRRAICKQLCLKEERKAGRQAGKRQGSRKIYGMFLYQHACVIMHKKYLFFKKKKGILIDTNLLEAALEILCNICC